MKLKIRMMGTGSALALSAAATAASAIAYASISPTSQLWGETLAHAPAGEIALSYDDGPNGGDTEELLGILAAAGVRATFFLIGRHVRQQPAIARAVHAGGHAIGNHTDSHPNLFLLSPRRVREEIMRAQQRIEDAIGAAVTFFRPPFGARRPDVLHIVRELGLLPVLWNVTCYDWKPTSPERVLAHARRQLRRNDRRNRGSIVLMHDGGHLALGADRSHTIEATRRLLALYRGRFRAL